MTSSPACRRLVPLWHLFLADNIWFAIYFINPIVTVQMPPSSILTFTPPPCLKFSYYPLSVAASFSLVSWLSPVSYPHQSSPLGSHVRISCRFPPRRSMHYHTFLINVHSPPIIPPRRHYRAFLPIPPPSSPSLAALSSLIPRLCLLPPFYALSAASPIVITSTTVRSTHILTPTRHLSRHCRVCLRRPSHSPSLNCFMSSTKLP